MVLEAPSRPRDSPGMAQTRPPAFASRSWMLETQSALDQARVRGVTLDT